MCERPANAKKIEPSDERTPRSMGLGSNAPGPFVRKENRVSIQSHKAAMACIDWKKANELIKSAEEDIKSALQEVKTRYWEYLLILDDYPPQIMLTVNLVSLAHHNTETSLVPIGIALGAVCDKHHLKSYMFPEHFPNPGFDLSMEYRLKLAQYPKI